jgi:hypothetical protein
VSRCQRGLVVQLGRTTRAHNGPDAARSRRVGLDMADFSARLEAEAVSAAQRSPHAHPFT